MSKVQFPELNAINLEPWYEGINNNFYDDLQLKAFWYSVSSGAISICYGAHGIWNVGDGDFLSHWGKQTFEDALKLKTPELIGKSFTIINEYNILEWNMSSVKIHNDTLEMITRSSNSGNTKL